MKHKHTLVIVRNKSDQIHIEGNLPLEHQTSLEEVVISSPKCKKIFTLHSMEVRIITDSGAVVILKAV